MIFFSVNLFLPPQFSYESHRIYSVCIPHTQYKSADHNVLSLCHLVQTITQQIILPYLQINVDPNIAPHRIPYFEFDTKEYEDLSVFADAIPKLTGIGVQISESWVRDKLGIPEPQEG